MELVIADGDQTSWIGKLPAFERCGDALIGDTGKDHEGDETDDDESDVARALWKHDHEGSVSARPYFSMRE
jgi:hypothetical protein